MARIVQLSTLIEDTRRWANIRTSTPDDAHLTDSDVSRVIELKLAEFHEILTSATGTAFQETVAAVAIVAGAGSLPDDFFRLNAAWVEWSTTDHESLRNLPAQQDATLFQGGTWQSGSAKAFRVVGSELRVYPPATTGTVQISYVPAFVSADEYDCVNGWEKYVTMGAACELLAIENRTNPKLEAEYEKQDERIRSMAEERQAQDAVQVRDAEYTSIGYSSGSGSAAVSTPALASSITYDPTAAALLSTTVQGALDELAALPTMAALRAVTPVTNKVAFTKSYATLGDGGGGSWYGVAGSPGDYTHNGGTVIVPSGGNGSAAWLRDFTGPVYPEWFGATGDGSTLDTTAFTAMAAASPKAVELGAKDYALDAQVTFQGPVTIRGAGMASTRLIWDGALGSCGLEVLTGAGHDDKCEVTDMDLVRTGARGDGTALLIDGSATIDTGTIQPRTSARSYVNNVRARGSSQLTDSWDIGLEMLSVLGGDIGTFDFVGSYTTAAPAWDGTAAVYIHGPGSAVEYNIDLIRAYSVATGLQVGGDGDQIEGVIVDKVLMVNVGKGVAWEDGGPQLRIASGHIAAWSGAVHADDCSQLSLGGLLCYALDGHDASYRHIYLKDCFLPNVAGCTFVDLEGTPDATNIYLENADGAMIGPNNHQNGVTGVLVDSGCGGVNVDAQVYADEDTVRVDDSGSGTIIADRRIRFFSSGLGTLGDSRITATVGDGSVGSGTLTIEAASVPISGNCSAAGFRRASSTSDVGTSASPFRQFYGQLATTWAAAGSGTGSYALTWASGAGLTVTVTGNSTITGFTFPAPGQYLLKVINTGAFTFAWPSAMLSPAGTDPTVTSSGTDLFELTYDGTTAFMRTIGQAYA